MAAARFDICDTRGCGCDFRRRGLANVRLMFHDLRMSESQRQIDKERRPGRGAASRETGRFERLRYEDAHDGWEIEEDLPKLRTEVSDERPRSLINYVSSPDIPFDRTINPYRGCEHEILSAHVRAFGDATLKKLGCNVIGLA